MSDANQQNTNEKTEENKPSDSENKDAKNNAPTESGDPGRTPGSAEGDEETIDADIRQKEAEGKL